MTTWIVRGVIVCVLALGTSVSWAQQTAGNITGRIVDAQGAAVPGATVNAVHTGTGFTRSAVTDAEGLYRLTALPVGTYNITVELSGFRTVDRTGIILNVSQTIDINFTLEVASVTERVTVTGASPLIENSASAVGGVVEVGTIENLPLNGRQFANLAATIPGVGLGFHSDPTKSTQFSPQINGGNGRNVNYQIDGGDNNDDTVGGLLQLFPLEAIQEFNVITARYKAEYGRSNGGVMNVVTKSGTNTVMGSWFTLLRDDAMNAKTFTEKIGGVDKQDYRRYQYGGSIGGPIDLNRAHFFAAYERTQQDTLQTVSTRGLFPSLDGTFATPVRENLFTTKETVNISDSQYLSVRYGRNTNSQPYGANSVSPPSNWGDSENTFNSFNVNHNWVVRGTMLNEFIFQFADFKNSISARSGDPTENFPNGVSVGQNGNTPQQTQQRKWQFRDDFSWHTTGWGGLGHDFKAGVNFINQPRLFITFNVATNAPTYTHISNDPAGPIQTVTLNGGAAEANIPTKQFAMYLQDDWRLTDRLTLNLGYRYDLLTGYDIDQSANPNFQIIDAAARAGRFAGIAGFEDFGKERKNDTNNHQPRVGFAYDVRGNGRDVVRGGWGIYYDVGYTNANVLFAAIDATGIGSGVIFQVNNSTGIRNPDGTFFQVGQPLSNIEHLNEANPNQLPLIGHVSSPRIEQPFSRQASLGWSHQLDDATVVDVDYVHIDGRDLGWRPRLNQRVPGAGATAPRVFADLPVSPANFRIAVSNGESTYDGLNLGIRRRLSRGMSFNAWYSISRAKSTTGNSSDELDQNNIQSILDPFGDVQNGPSRRSDARHRFTASAVFQLPGDVTVSPIFRFRSALPVYIIQGTDLNADGQRNDIPTTAFAFDTLNDDGTFTFKEIGACETINCGRGAPFSQVNLRVSKAFRLYRTLRVEAIGEIFNLFNAKNPDGFRNPTQQINPATGQPDPSFMEPTAFAGDFQQPEQRIGQIGFRIIF
jgi:hypothetical protein